MSDPTRNPFIGKKRSQESREKQSKTRTAKFLAGEYSGWFKKGSLETSKGGLIHYRSSWEKNFAEKLDVDVNVKSFKFEKISIPYYLQEGERLNLRHYIPDFFVEYADGRQVLTEVKPQFFLDAAINIAKFAAARERCTKEGWEFQVLTQEDL